jgi:glutaredoxin 3
MSVVIHAKVGCPYCVKAIDLLHRNGIKYREITYDPLSPTYTQNAQKLMAQTGSRTFPQIFIDGKFIGGYAELSKLNLNNIKNVEQRPIKKSPAKRPAQQHIQRVPVQQPIQKVPIQRVPVQTVTVQRPLRSPSKCRQYTVFELRKMAAAKQIVGRSRMNRAQLCNVLKI